MAADHLAHEQAAHSVDLFGLDGRDGAAPIAAQAGGDRRLEAAADRLGEPFGQERRWPARRPRVGVRVNQLVVVRQHGRVNLNHVFLGAAADVGAAAGVGDVFRRVPVVGDLAVGHLQHGREVRPVRLERGERVLARERLRQRQQGGVDVQAKVLRLTHERRRRLPAARGDQQACSRGRVPAALARSARVRLPSRNVLGHAMRVADGWHRVGAEGYRFDHAEQRCAGGHVHPRRRGPRGSSRAPPRRPIRSGRSWAGSPGRDPARRPGRRARRRRLLAGGPSRSRGPVSSEGGCPRGTASSGECC